MEPTPAADMLLPSPRPSAARRCSPSPLMQAPSRSARARGDWLMSQLVVPTCCVPPSSLAASRLRSADDDRGRLRTRPCSGDTPSLVSTCAASEEALALASAGHTSPTAGNVEVPCADAPPIDVRWPMGTTATVGPASSAAAGLISSRTPCNPPPCVREPSKSERDSSSLSLPRVADPLDVALAAPAQSEPKHSAVLVCEAASPTGDLSLLEPARAACEGTAPKCFGGRFQMRRYSSSSSSLAPASPARR
eukprot:scaffold9903_cov30-Tisochrysis_lutea.AAC.3